MALIVGIRCDDSVVLAASGPAASADVNRRAGTRSAGRKLRALAGQAVLGVSGSEGLAQEMALSLERALGAPDDRERDEEALRQKIREALAAPVQRTAAIHRTLNGLPGQVAGSGAPARCDTLLAIPLQRSLRLYSFERDCSLTEITTELGFAVVGEAALFAESCLTFLAKLLWGKGVASGAQAELAAYWTLQHAIENAHGSLSGPVQLVVMSRTKQGIIEIVERGESEAVRIRDAIARGEETIRNSVRPQGSGTHLSGESPSVAPARKRVPEVRLVMDRSKR